MPRCFVAIEMPSAIQEALHGLGRDVRGARPVPRPQIHLTLRFLGEVGEPRWGETQRQLEGVSALAFGLTLRGVGTFPSPRRPRVLWAGVAPEAGLDELQRCVEQAVVAAGADAEPKRFHPHVTVARAKTTTRGDARTWLDAHAAFLAPAFRVDAFHLFSSRLGPDGARHRIRGHLPAPFTELTARQPCRNSPMRIRSLTTPKPLHLVLVLALAVAALAAATAATSAATGTPTHLDVRVLSKGAKFVGTSMGGADVVVADADTGEVLARGRTSGSTGDTGLIMRAEQPHHAPVSTPEAAVFRATLDLERPLRVRVVARGPLAQPQTMGESSQTIWLVPGKHVTGGDGLRLELPGLVVDVLAPAAHVKLAGTPLSVTVAANVTMTCGCPIEPGGTWDAAGFEVEAWLERNGVPERMLRLPYAGRTSRFAETITIREPGAYVVTVTAHQPATGNTGLDRTSFLVRD